MSKNIQLRVATIKYSGDSIGDDIRIEIDCLNASLDLDRSIKRGKEVLLNVFIGNFVTDQPSFSLPLS